MPVVGFAAVGEVLIMVLVITILLVVTYAEIQNLLNTIPVIGGGLSSAHAAIVQWLTDHWTPFLQSSASLLASVIAIPYQRIVATIGELIHTQDSTIQAVNQAPQTAIGYVHDVEIPPILNAINNQAVTEAQDRYALTVEIENVDQVTAANHRETQGWVDNLSQNVGAFNQWAIDQLQAHSVTEAVNHEESRSWVDNLSANVSAFNGWAVNQLQAQAQSIGHVESEALNAAASAQAAAIAYAGQAAAAAGTSAVTYTVTNVIPQVTAITTAFDTYLKDCGDPMCEGLLPSAKGLSTLAQLAGDVALIELVIAMLTDPAGTADAIESVIGPLARDVIGGIRAVTGM